MKKVLGCISLLLLASTVSWAGPAKIDTTGLVAWYPFSGNADDASGHGHNGTVNGAALTLDRFGTSNNAYLFDGVNDYIQVPYSADLNPSSRITVAAWFKADTWGGTSYSNAILSTELCSPDKGYGLRGGDGTVTFFISCSGSWIHAITAPGSVLTGHWYFLVGTYDGTA
ncbi:MAG: LamG-like jellyroll fold domain-containing protein, partial [Deltaproteobacteria bacterium]|nr:LamG-like jellyroll fold domain-containing protein [Deltaproteobacteria bacterium]